MASPRTLESILCDGDPADYLTLDAAALAAAALPQKCPTLYEDASGREHSARVMAAVAWTGKKTALPSQGEYELALRTNTDIKIPQLIRELSMYFCVGEHAVAPFKRALEMPWSGIELYPVGECCDSPHLAANPWTAVSFAVATIICNAYKTLASDEAESAYFGIQHAVVVTAGHVDVFVESSTRRLDFRIHLDWCDTVGDLLRKQKLPADRVAYGILNGMPTTVLSPEAAVAHIYRRIQLDTVFTNGRHCFDQIGLWYSAGYAVDIAESAEPELKLAGFYLVDPGAITPELLADGPAEPGSPLPPEHAIATNTTFGYNVNPTDNEMVYRLQVDPNSINEAYPEGFPVAAIAPRAMIHNGSVLARRAELSALVWVHIGTAEDMRLDEELPTGAIRTFAPIWEWDANPPRAAEAIGALSALKAHLQRTATQNCVFRTGSIPIGVLVDYFGLTPQEVGVFAANVAKMRTIDREGNVNLTQMLLDAPLSAIMKHAESVLDTPLEYWRRDAPPGPPSAAPARFVRHATQSAPDAAADGAADGAAPVEYDPVCPICLGPTNDPEGEPVARLPCGHVLHRGSDACAGLDAWLKKSNKCPTCSTVAVPLIVYHRPTFIIRPKTE